MPMSSDGNAQYYVGVGRRKEAVARIRLYSGERGIVVNGRPIEDYFPRIMHQNVVQEPLDLVGASFRVSAKVVGGGISGQAEAIRHGVARALVNANDQYRLSLRKSGMLTRDARVKERKKYGLKRARKAPQYTKR
ncbi:MAG: 30S ribosomal protein S9 [Chloroflexi bacterium]|nr:30S ribosomal protein S9 [Chloroflexota bacterium]